MYVNHYALIRRRRESQTLPLTTTTVVRSSLERQQSSGLATLQDPPTEHRCLHCTSSRTASTRLCPGNMRNNNTTCARYAVLAAAILLGQSVLVDSFEEINVYAVDPGDYTLQVGPADSSGETTLAFMVALTDTTDEEGLESAEEATSEGKSGRLI